MEFKPVKYGGFVINFIKPKKDGPIRMEIREHNGNLADSLDVSSKEEGLNTEKYLIRRFRTRQESGEIPF